MTSKRKCGTTFAQRLYYLPGDASNNLISTSSLKTKLEAMQQRRSQQDVLFYVSTSASLAARIVEGLGGADWRVAAKAGPASCWKSLLATTWPAPRS